MYPPGRSTSSAPCAHVDTANDRFHRCYDNWVAAGILLAVVAHATFIQTFPPLHAAVPTAAAHTIRMVNLPPPVRVPPPPERIARPAVPRVGSVDVDEDITISKTTFEENPVEQLGPPPPARKREAKRRPFIPYDVAPRLLNGEEIRRVLQREYPRSLRQAGLGGRVVLWVFVNARGVVEKAQVEGSSGNATLDEAARQVALRMRFSPALNRDRPTAVWVQQPVAFSVRR
ncbi:MAG: energy transducer TonB [Gemmatimonadota bacterium]